jgi:tol-pal system protein YbgF
MRFTQSWLAVGAIVLTMALPNVSWAKSELETRITRLENIVENEINIGFLNQLDALQAEIRELRGKIEVQQNALQAVDQKQEKLYANIDQRLNSLNGTAQDATASADNVADAPVILDTQQIAYDNACKLMHSKQYADAVNEFKDLIWQNPKGKYVANAQYWLGEIYLLQWGQKRTDQSLLVQAKESFNAVVSKHQDNPKAGEALLKLGLIEIDLGHWQQAQELLTKVINQEPNSSRARIAESKLQRMRSQGQI